MCYPRSLYAVWASENGNRDEAWREQRKYDRSRRTAA